MSAQEYVRATQSAAYVSFVAQQRVRVRRSRVRWRRSPSGEEGDVESLAGGAFDRLAGVELPDAGRPDAGSCAGALANAESAVAWLVDEQCLLGELGGLDMSVTEGEQTGSRDHPRQARRKRRPGARASRTWSGSVS